MILSGKIREKQENRNRIRRNQISRRGRGAAGDRGAFNLERACYFWYCPDVVCFYTDLKNKAESIQKPKGCPLNGLPFP